MSKTPYNKDNKDSKDAIVLHCDDSYLFKIGKGLEKDIKLMENYYLAIANDNKGCTDNSVYANLGTLYYVDFNDDYKAFDWYTKLYQSLSESDQPTEWLKYS